MYEVARASDVLFHLDRAARLQAIRGAVEAGISSRIFINFNPTSLYDPASCLRTTIAAVQEANIEPGRIIFEVVESDRAPYDLNRIFAVYRDAGFRVALDDLGAGYGSLNLLGTLKPDFVKLDMALIRDVDRDPYKAGITAKLIEMAQRSGDQHRGRRDRDPRGIRLGRDRQGVDFVQGYLLARPACPPPLPRPLPGASARPESEEGRQAIHPDATLGGSAPFLRVSRALASGFGTMRRYLGIGRNLTMSGTMTPHERAIGVAALCGSKIALGPAFLETSRRRPNARAWVAGLLGEMLLDKIGVFPPRWRPLLLVPHTLAGAWVARESLKEDGIDDPSAVLMGAVAAAGVAGVAPMLRIALSRGLGVPDPLLGVAEDYLFLQLGSRATGMAMDELPEIAKDAVGEIGGQVRPALESIGVGGRG